MTTRIAINGFGRIGRNILRAWIARNMAAGTQLEIVAINDLAPLETNVHLLKYDSVHGVCPADIQAENTLLQINGRSIAMFAEANPEKLPWGALQVDVVFECTGRFADKEKAAAHLTAGAKRVLVSAPAANADKTVVFGVNHHTLTAADRVVSNASCTTNCLAPIAKILHDAVGIQHGLMTTIHAYTNDQQVLDLAHKDLHRARAAGLSMIPTSTGAAKAVGLVLPELAGKLDGFSMRVPTPNVSVVDFTFTPNRPTTAEEINQLFDGASKSEHWQGVLGYNVAPLVSIDFNGSRFSSVFDATQTRVLQHAALIKVLAWYDNETGFSNRMLDVAAFWGKMN